MLNYAKYTSKNLPIKAFISMRIKINLVRGIFHILYYSCDASSRVWNYNVSSADESVIR